MARLALTEGRGKEQAGCHDFDRGRYCGSTLAYYEAAVLTQRLAELDPVDPITHFARIVKPPIGEAPQAVREAIVGMQLHVREGLQKGEQGGPVVIHLVDFILGLHDHGRIAEAAWYKQYASQKAQKGMRLDAWYFQPEEVDVWENAVPRKTAAEYGKNAWNYSMLGSVWMGFVLPQELFDPESEEGRVLFEKLRETYGDHVENLAMHLIADKFANNHLIAMIRKGPGRTTTYDTETRDVTEIWDNGALVYDRDQGVDNR